MSEMMGIPESDTSLPVVVPDLVLDPEKYQQEMADFDISEEQKRELLETLWSIMRLFVELGYSVDVSGQMLNQIFQEAARGSLTEGQP